MLQGVGVSPGVGIGRAVLVKRKEPDYSHVKPDTPQKEAQRLELAVQAVSLRLEQLTHRLVSQAGTGAGEILACQRTLLADPEMKLQAAQLIAKGLCAEAAVDTVCRNFSHMLRSMEDELMQQRAADVEDLRVRLLHQLLGTDLVDLAHLAPGSILVVDELTPSMTVGMDREHLCAIVTETGGRTSHSAILARALEIPAVQGVAGALRQISNGALLVVDGEKGCIYRQPPEPILEEYKEKQREFEQRRQMLRRYRDKSTVDAQGQSVPLYANIGGVQDAQAALEAGAEGIGLFRTELLFMNQDHMPTEEHQRRVYQQVATLFAGKPVIIRTLDVGGDKAVEYLHMQPEANPFLGHRAVRYCLSNPDLYLVQLRALLRAAAVYKNIRIMLPLVTSLEEVRAAKALLEQAKEQLSAEGLVFDENIPLGIMVETPAACQIADLLAQEVDFFSIGTNDLTQYTLAVDRGNPLVESLYTPYHPAVLRSIRQIITAAHQAGIPVGMCGEAASDPALIPLFLAWGLDEYSVSPSSILATRHIIGLWDTERAKQVESEAMKLSSIQGLQGYLHSMCLK